MTDEPLANQVPCPQSGVGKLNGRMREFSARLFQHRIHSNIVGRLRKYTVPSAILLLEISLQYGIRTVFSMPDQVTD